MSKNKFNSPPFMFVKKAVESNIQGPPFLKKKISTYFGAEQKPDLLNSSVSYYPPTEWIPKGRILRMPQMVWLETRIFLADQITYNNTLVNAGDIHAEGAGPNILWTHDGAYTNFTPPGAPWHSPSDYSDVNNFSECQSQPNLASIENQRLVEIFKNVKDKIEKIRKGKTWVEVIDWFGGWKIGDEGSIPSGLGVEIDGGVFTQYLVTPPDITTIYYKSLTPTTDYGASWASFIEAPLPGAAFLGTNFLSIYCGNVFITGFNNIITEYTPRTYPSATDVLETSDFKFIYNNYKISTPLFYGLSSKLFHPDLSWLSWSIDSRGDALDLDETFTSWETFDEALQTGSWQHSTIYHCLPFTPNDGLENAGINEANNKCINNVTFTNDVFDKVAEKAKNEKDDRNRSTPLDIQHVGGTSLITEDYLIQLIAKHFKFHPTSGKDLT